MIYLQIIEIFEHCNVFCGVSFNMILIYLICKYSRPNLGTYKNLLYVFATYDIFISIVHGVIDHKVLIVDTMFVAVSKSFTESRALTAFFCAASTIPFALVITNFLYRYWAVEYPERVRLFSSRIFGCFIAIICFLGSVSWYCAVYFGGTGEEESLAKNRARVAYRREYGEVIMEGYVLIEHWKDGNFNLPPALILLYMDSVILACIIIACALAHRTLYCIRKTTRLSGYSRMLQGRLLIALCAQTAVPVVCVYIPYFIVLTCPFFGLSIRGVTGSMIILNSCFPSVDAIVIIALMTDYRNGLKTMVMKLVRLRGGVLVTVSVVTEKRSMHLT